MQIVVTTMCWLSEKINYELSFKIVQIKMKGMCACAPVDSGTDPTHACTLHAPVRRHIPERIFPQKDTSGSFLN